jgi:hypothetical protein
MACFAPDRQVDAFAASFPTLRDRDRHSRFNPESSCFAPELPRAAAGGGTLTIAVAVRQCAAPTGQPGTTDHAFDAHP